MKLKKDFVYKFVYYVIIGVIGVLVDIVVANVFYNLIFGANMAGNLWTFNTFWDGKNIEIHVSETLSAILGGIAGLVNNFVLNEFFVYKDNLKSYKLVTKRFSKYFATILVGTFFIGKIIFLNLICLSLLNLGFTTSNLIAIALGTFINYPINYFWTWGSFSVSHHLKRKKKDLD
ncbi:MAG: GtrA family protein [bacterium]